MANALKNQNHQLGGLRVVKLIEIFGREKEEFHYRERRWP
jgi:hypothetical protein